MFRLSDYRIIKLSATIISFILLVSSAFALQMPHFQGEEVVVIAAKYDQPRYKSPWNVTVIGEKEIKAANSRTVGEILRGVSGADIRAVGDLGSLSTAGLRIIGADKTLVLIDGRKINSPLNGMVDLNDLLLDNVAKIEIIKSPASALYGSEATGGVINIITKQGQQVPSSDLALSFGSFGSNQYKASVSGGNGYLLVENLKSEGFRQNADYNSANLKGNYGWKLLNTDLKVDALFYSAQKGAPNVPSTDAWSASKPKDRQDDQNVYLDLSSKTKWGQNGELSARVFRDSGTQTFRSFNLPGTIETRTKNNFAQTGIVIDNLQRLEKGNLLCGAEFREDNGDSSASGSHNVNNLALYLQWESELLNAISVVAGVRGDKHSVAGSSFNPRLGLLFPMGQDLSLRAAYGTSFRAPTINELYWSNSIYETGNPSLSPEKSRTWEMGLRKTYGHSLLQLTYHNSDYSDLIYWGTDPTTWVLSPSNIASAKIEGVDLEIEHQFTSIVSGFANYTYQKSTGTDPTGSVTVSGEDLIYMPRNKFNVGLRLNDEKFGNGSLSLRYVGERNYIDAPPPTYTNMVKQLPSYLVVDLKAFKTIGNYNLSIGADNIFNASYNETTGFSPLGGLPAVGYPAPSRKITVTVGYNL